MKKVFVALPFLSITLLLACSDNDSQANFDLAVASVSSDRSVQAAYGGCVKNMAQSLIEDNPGTDKDIMQMMLQPVPEMCFGAVVKPCEKDRKGFLCKTMIAEYESKPSAY